MHNYSFEYSIVNVHSNYFMVLEILPYNFATLIKIRSSCKSEEPDELWNFVTPKTSH